MLTADVVTVRPAARLRGGFALPGDKSITHRALLLAAMAAGASRIEGGSDALDPHSTAGCLRALGVEVERRAGTDGNATWTVRSAGWASWRQPRDTLDCGNSGTTMRLLAGALAGVSLEVSLDGDASLRARPMGRVITPLTAMGAVVRSLHGDDRPPLHIVGRRTLRPIDHTTPVPSAQVKSAILLAALAGEGTTIVRESVATRDHTERMLRARGVAVGSVADDRTGQTSVSLEGGQTVQAGDERVPGDISAAAFWLVAGAAHPDAELTLTGVGVNATRRMALDLLRRMGARIDERPLATKGGEPAADLIVRSSALEAIDVSPAETAAAIDEIPVLCLAASCARGTSRIRGAGELRHKESDRLAGIAVGLGALGARIAVEGDDLVIEGGAGRPGFGLRAGEAKSHDDHRLAMTFAVAGLLAGGATTLDGATSVSVSYPTFFDHLERARA
ncbi:MAG: 3-phosphoshikimate 1-carboxyvinyltransferase [Candidatus Limnocylindrales bacterium]